MQITIDRTNLDAVAASLPRKGGTMPPLARLTARDGSLTIIASNDATGEAMRFRRACVVGKPGEAVVDASLLVEAIRSAGDTLTITAEARRLVLTWGRSRHAIPLVPDLYPREPVTAEGAWTVGAAALVRAIVRTVGYVETGRATAMNGIYVHADPQNPRRAVFVATDRHRLSVASIEALSDVVTGRHTTMPAEVANAIVRMVGKRASTVSIGVASGVVSVAVDDDAASWPALDADFPDFRAIVPRADLALVRHTSPEFIAALKRHTAATSGTPTGTLMVFNGESLKLGTVREDVQAIDEVTAESDHAGTWERGVRAMYLAEAIETVGGDAAIYSGPSAAAPMLLHGADRGEDGYVIVMPMALNAIARGDL